MSTIASVCLVGIAASLMLGPMPQTSELVRIDPDAAIVADGGRIARIGIADLAERRAWVVVPLVASGDDLRDAEPRVVASALRYVDVPGRVDVLRRANAMWSLVQDIHRGGSLMLEVTEVRENPFDAAATPAASPVSQQSELPRGRVFTEVEVTSDTGSSLFLDLFAPRLVEQDGLLHVIASSLPIAGSSDAVTWIAALPAEGTTLAASRIGNGADARVAQFGNEHVCLVRALTPSQRLDDAAPIHIYWSGDLTTWQPALPLDEETPLVDYDLLADSGSLWVVGVTPGAISVVCLWRLEMRDGIWKEQPIDVELPDARTRVRLIGSTVGLPYPKLVIPAADGTARVVPLVAK